MTQCADAVHLLRGEKVPEATTRVEYLLYNELHILSLCGDCTKIILKRNPNFGVLDMRSDD